VKILPTVLCLITALAIGLSVAGVVQAQDPSACSKCCGFSFTNSGYRTSYDCVGNSCLWFQCANGCETAACPGSAISCGGTYATYVDSCYNDPKCPCDSNAVGDCPYGCSRGY
jgi:hypothetical protein